MKQRKGLLSILIAGALALTACGGTASASSSSAENSDSSFSSSSSSQAGTDSSSGPQENYVEVIQDATFQNGFGVKGNDQATDGVLPLLNLKYGDDEPIWTVGQWGSRYDLSEQTPMISSGVVILRDQAKTLKVNRFQNKLSLGVSASLEYDTMEDSRVMWSHLLIEQEFPNFTSHRLNEFKRLDVTLDFNVTMANKGAIETKDPDGSFPAPHTLPAQFLQYFYVVNRNPESAGYGSFLWFGLGYLDTRYESLPLSYLQDHAGGNLGNYIYCVAAEDILGAGAFQRNHTYNVRMDILPHIKLALINAQEHGFMYNTKLEDCTITGMNLGWEVVGAWDVNADVSNLSLKAIFND